MGEAFSRNSSVVALAVDPVLPILGTVGWSWFAWVIHPPRRSQTLSSVITQAVPVATPLYHLFRKFKEQTHHHHDLNREYGLQGHVRI